MAWTYCNVLAKHIIKDIKSDQEEENDEIDENVN
jgi:hypothetical protein